MNYFIVAPIKSEFVFAKKTWKEKSTHADIRIPITSNKFSLKIFSHIFHICFSGWATCMLLCNAKTILKKIETVKQKCISDAMKAI